MKFTKSELEMIFHYAAADKIDKIVVGEKQVVDGEKIQRVRIVYNFVGELAD